MLIVTAVLACFGPISLVALVMIVVGHVAGRPELEHRGNGLGAVSFTLVAAGDALVGQYLWAAVGAIAAIWCAIDWWHNRRNGKWKRAARALGAKSKARVEALIENMTPSPIPSPVGGVA